MPKDEFDPEDPMELCGVGLLTEEDTSEFMAECFIEEFLRMGYNARQVLALFRNPHYTGMNMVMQNRGEQFVKDKIVEVFGWWGRPVAAGILPAVEPGFEPGGQVASTAGIPDAPEAHNCPAANPGGKMPPSTAGRMPAATDPMGNEIPPLD